MRFSAFALLLAAIWNAGMLCSAANAGWFLRPQQGWLLSNYRQDQPLEVDHGSLLTCRDNESRLWQSFGLSGTRMLVFEARYCYFTSNRLLFHICLMWEFSHYTDIRFPRNLVTGEICPKGLSILPFGSAKGRSSHYTALHGKRGSWHWIIYRKTLVGDADRTWQVRSMDTQIIRHHFVSRNIIAFRESIYSSLHAGWLSVFFFEKKATSGVLSVGLMANFRPQHVFCIQRP